MSAADPSHSFTPEALVALSRAATTARLLSGVIHEINNALLVVSGTVELLESRTDLPDAAIRPLERLRTQCGRMAASIAQVTAFTQAIPASNATVRLADIARASVDLRRFAATRAGLSLEIVPAECAAVVTGNAGALQHAILNLLVAVEQTLAGTRGRIAVALAVQDGLATVRVSGTPGAPTPATSAPPAQPATDRGVADPAGLGLLAADQIARAHGGTLAVDSDPGGVAWVLRIPSVPASGEQARRAG